MLLSPRFEEPWVADPFNLTQGRQGLGFLQPSGLRRYHHSGQSHFLTKILIDPEEIVPVTEQRPQIVVHRANKNGGPQPAAKLQNSLCR